MKIAIISDVHDNFHNLVLFFKQVEKYEVQQIIFLGDLVNAGAAKILAGSPIPVVAIWGNNDGEKVNITKTAMAEKSNMSIGSTTYDFLEFDSRKIFITHYPSLVRSMAKSEDFDAVFYGHNHLKNIDKIGDCLIVNPGEISAHKTGEASFAIYDTTSNEAELVTVVGAISTNTKEVTEYLQALDFEFSKSKTHKY